MLPGLAERWRLPYRESNRDPDRTTHAPAPAPSSASNCDMRDIGVS